MVDDTGHIVSASVVIVMLTIPQTIRYYQRILIDIYLSLWSVLKTHTPAHTMGSVDVSLRHSMLLM